MSTPEFDLFTSLRYDPRLLYASWNTWSENPTSSFLLLPYHYDRLLEAARQFKWSAAVDVLTTTGRSQAVASLKSLCQECVDGESNSRGPLRIRIILSRQGVLKAQAFPIIPLQHDLFYAATFHPDASASFQFPSRQLRVYIDTEPTPQSEYTSCKTTARAHYDAARARVGISATVPEEVILYNCDGDVMEGSIHNVAFWRNGRWVTPGLESGCLAGTARRWLLERGHIIEARIKREDIKVGEWVLLCNGVEGCLLGVVSSR